MSAAMSSPNAHSESVLSLCCSPLVPQNWDRCHAYLTKKKRFCRQRPQPPSVYCGNHQHLDSTLKDAGSTAKRKRIPCPVDPSHMIFEDMVSKHVLVCPRATKRKRQTEQVYFSSNINAGGYGALRSGISVEAQAVRNQEWAERLALRVLEVHQSIFGENRHHKDDEQESKKPSFSPRQLTWHDLHDSISTQDLSQLERDAGIVEGFRAHRIKSGGARHIPQLASLVGHLRKIQVLPSLKPSPQSTSQQNYPEVKPLVFLEMGAGRGTFGLTAAGVAAANDVPTRLIMVERTGSRSKADKIFRTAPTKSADQGREFEKSYLNLHSVKWSRIECDLAHVNLPSVLVSGGDDLGPSGGVKEGDQGIEKSRVVVIAKHLCGAGTDLALKSMEPIRERVHACVLATCCHGICDWKEYVGREFLSKIMATSECPFGPEEFDLIRRWCAGSVASAVKGSKDSRRGPESLEQFNCKSEQDLPDNEENEEDEPDHDSNTPANNDVENCFKTSDKHMNSGAKINISAIVDSLVLRCGAQGLGRACQRLIDYGRKKYLQEVIFTGNDSKVSSEICHYVSPQVSPQNACIICCRR